MVKFACLYKLVCSLGIVGHVFCINVLTLLMMFSLAPISGAYSVLCGSSSPLGCIWVQSDITINPQWLSSVQQCRQRQDEQGL